MSPEFLDNWSSVALSWPSIILGFTAALVIIQDLFESKQTWAAPFLTLFGLGAAAYLLWKMPYGPDTVPVGLFQGMAALDPFSFFFQAFFVVVAAIVVLMSARSKEISENKGEYYALLLVMTLGMIMLASAYDLLMVYLALETVSICSYILVGWTQHDRKSSEASLKYVLYGAVASGIMLYGLSLLYGMTGSTGFADVAVGLRSQPPLVVSFAALLVFAGFGYKIASVPFHMWAPDVYQGAPTPITAFLTVGPKAAGFAALIRFFYGVLAAPRVGGPEIEQTWTATSATAWPALMALLAVATMTVGNFSALGQTSVKRLLGYSSIAHAGYMLMGFVVLSQEGLQSILFYLIVYCAMNIGAFLVVAAVADDTGNDDISSFKGLGVRSPFAAISMAIFLFSLIGLPPLAGFAGKLHLFVGVIHKALEVGNGFNMYYMLAIAGVLNSIVSLYYYARILKVMFLETVPEGAARRPAIVAPTFYVLMGFLVVPTVLLGLFWGGTLDIARRSISFFGVL